MFHVKFDLKKTSSAESLLELKTELEYLKQNKISLKDCLTNDEMNPLHFQVKKLQKLLVDEQGIDFIYVFIIETCINQLFKLLDKFTKLQKRLQESETQRLELISQNNKESFSLNTKYAKLRTDFEKSEAARQTLEYELSLAKTNFNKEKQVGLDKERMLEEISKNYQGN